MALSAQEIIRRSNQARKNAIASEREKRQQGVPSGGTPASGSGVLNLGDTSNYDTDGIENLNIPGITPTKQDNSISPKVAKLMDEDQPSLTGLKQGGAIKKDDGILDYFANSTRSTWNAVVSNNQYLLADLLKERFPEAAEELYDSSQRNLEHSAYRSVDPEKIDTTSLQGKLNYMMNGAGSIVGSSSNFMATMLALKGAAWTITKAGNAMGPALSGPLSTIPVVAGVLSRAGAPMMKLANTVNEAKTFNQMLQIGLPASGLLEAGTETGGALRQDDKRIRAEKKLGVNDPEKDAELRAELWAKSMIGNATLLGLSGYAQAKLAPKVYNGVYRMITPKNDINTLNRTIGNWAGRTIASAAGSATTYPFQANEEYWQNYINAAATRTPFNHDEAASEFKSTFAGSFPLMPIHVAAGLFGGSPRSARIGNKTFTANKGQYNVSGEDVTAEKFYDMLGEEIRRANPNAKNAYDFSYENLNNPQAPESMLYYGLDNETAEKLAEARKGLQFAQGDDLRQNAEFVVKSMEPTAFSSINDTIETYEKLKKEHPEYLNRKNEQEALYDNQELANKLAQDKTDALNSKIAQKMAKDETKAQEQAQAAVIDKKLEELKNNYTVAEQGEFDKYLVGNWVFSEDVDQDFRDVIKNQMADGNIDVAMDLIRRRALASGVDPESVIKAAQQQAPQEETIIEPEPIQQQPQQQAPQQETPQEQAPQEQAPVQAEPVQQQKAAEESSVNPVSEKPASVKTKQPQTKRGTKKPSTKTQKPVTQPTAQAAQTPVAEQPVVQTPATEQTVEPKAEKTTEATPVVKAKEETKEQAPKKRRTTKKTKTEEKTETVSEEPQEATEKPKAKRKTKTKTEEKAEPKAEAKVEEKAETKVETKAEPKAEEKAETKVEEAAQKPKVQAAKGSVMNESESSFVDGVSYKDETFTAGLKKSKGLRVNLNLDGKSVLVLAAENEGSIFGHWKAPGKSGTFTATNWTDFVNKINQVAKGESKLSDFAAKAVLEKDIDNSKKEEVEEKEATPEEKAQAALDKIKNLGKFARTEERNTFAYGSSKLVVTPTKDGYSVKQSDGTTAEYKSLNALKEAFKETESERKARTAIASKMRALGKLDEIAGFKKTASDDFSVTYSDGTDTIVITPSKGAFTATINDSSTKSCATAKELTALVKDLAFDAIRERIAARKSVEEKELQEKRKATEAKKAEEAKKKAEEEAKKKAEEEKARKEAEEKAKEEAKKIKEANEKARKQVNDIGIPKAIGKYKYGSSINGEEFEAHFFNSRGYSIIIARENSVWYVAREHKKITSENFEKLRDDIELVPVTDYSAAINHFVEATSENIESAEKNSQKSISGNEDKFLQTGNIKITPVVRKLATRLLSVALSNTALSSLYNQFTGSAETISASKENAKTMVKLLRNFAEAVKNTSMKFNVISSNDEIMAFFESHPEYTDYRINKDGSMSYKLNGIATNNSKGFTHINKGTGERTILLSENTFIDAPIHEYGHIFVSLLNDIQYNKLFNVLKDTPLFKRISENMQIKKYINYLRRTDKAFANKTNSQILNAIGNRMQLKKMLENATDEAAKAIELSEEDLRSITSETYSRILGHYSTDFLDNEEFIRNVEKGQGFTAKVARAIDDSLNFVRVNVFNLEPNVNKNRGIVEFVNAAMRPILKANELAEDKALGWDDTVGKLQQQAKEKRAENNKEEEKTRKKPKLLSFATIKKLLGKGNEENTSKPMDIPFDAMGRKMTPEEKAEAIAIQKQKENEQKMRELKAQLENELENEIEEAEKELYDDEYDDDYAYEYDDESAENITEETNPVWDYFESKAVLASTVDALLNNKMFKSDVRTVRKNINKLLDSALEEGLLEQIEYDAAQKVLANDAIVKNSTYWNYDASVHEKAYKMLLNQILRGHLTEVLNKVRSLDDYIERKISSDVATAAEVSSVYRLHVKLAAVRILSPNGAKDLYEQLLTYALNANVITEEGKKILLDAFPDDDPNGEKLIDTLNNVIHQNYNKIAGPNGGKKPNQIITSDHLKFAVPIEYFEAFDKEHSHQANSLFRLDTGLAKGRRFLLTSGAGYGKSYVSAAYIYKFIKNNPAAKVLVLCPTLSAKNAWLGENGAIEKTARFNAGKDGKKAVNIVSKDAGDSSVSFDEKNPAVYVDLYSNLKNHKDVLNAEWDLVIADEIHTVSTNSTGRMSKTMQLYESLGHDKTKRLEISATPISYIENVDNLQSLFVDDSNDEKSVAEGYHNLASAMVNSEYYNRTRLFQFYSDNGIALDRRNENGKLIAQSYYRKARDRISITLPNGKSVDFYGQFGESLPHILLNYGIIEDFQSSDDLKGFLNMTSFRFLPDKLLKDVKAIVPYKEYISSLAVAKICLNDFNDINNNLERHFGDLFRIVDRSGALTGGEVSAFIKNYNVEDTSKAARAIKTALLNELERELRKPANVHRRITSGKNLFHLMKELMPKVYDKYQFVFNTTTLAQAEKIVTNAETKGIKQMGINIKQFRDYVSLSPGIVRFIESKGEKLETLDDIRLLNYVIRRFSKPKYSITFEKLLEYKDRLKSLGPMILKTNEKINNGEVLTAEEEKIAILINRQCEILSDALKRMDVAYGEAAEPETSMLRRVAYLTPENVRAIPHAEQAARTVEAIDSFISNVVGQNTSSTLYKVLNSMHKVSDNTSDDIVTLANSFKETVEMTKSLVTAAKIYQDRYANPERIGRTKEVNKHVVMVSFKKALEVNPFSAMSSFASVANSKALARWTKEYSDVLDFIDTNFVGKTPLEVFVNENERLAKAYNLNTSLSIFDDDEHENKLNITSKVGGQKDNETIKLFNINTDDPDAVDVLFATLSAAGVGVDMDERFADLTYSARKKHTHRPRVMHILGFINRPDQQEQAEFRINRDSTVNDTVVWYPTLGTDIENRSFRKYSLLGTRTSAMARGRYYTADGLARYHEYNNALKNKEGYNALVDGSNLVPSRYMDSNKVSATTLAKKKKAFANKGNATIFHINVENPKLSKLEKLGIVRGWDIIDELRRTKKDENFFAKMKALLSDEVNDSNRYLLKYKGKLPPVYFNMRTPAQVDELRNLSEEEFYRIVGYVNPFFLRPEKDSAHKNSLFTVGTGMSGHRLTQLDKIVLELFYGENAEDLYERLVRRGYFSKETLESDLTAKNPFSQVEVEGAIRKSLIDRVTGLKNWVLVIPENRTHMPLLRSARNFDGISSNQRIKIHLSPAEVLYLNNVKSQEEIDAHTVYEQPIVRIANHDIVRTAIAKPGVNRRLNIGQQIIVSKMFDKTFIRDYRADIKDSSGISFTDRINALFSKEIYDKDGDQNVPFFTYYVNLVKDFGEQLNQTLEDEYWIDTPEKLDDYFEKLSKFMVWQYKYLSERHHNDSDVQNASIEKLDKLELSLLDDPLDAFEDYELLYEGIADNINTKMVNVIKSMQLVYSKDAKLFEGLADQLTDNIVSKIGLKALGLAYEYSIAQPSEAELEDNKELMTSAISHMAKSTAENIIQIDDEDVLAPLREANTRRLIEGLNTAVVTAQSDFLTDNIDELMKDWKGYFTRRLNYLYSQGFDRNTYLHIIDNIMHQFTTMPMDAEYQLYEKAARCMNHTSGLVTCLNEGDAATFDIWNAFLTLTDKNKLDPEGTVKNLLRSWKKELDSGNPIAKDFDEKYGKDNDGIYVPYAALNKLITMLAVHARYDAWEQAKNRSMQTDASVKSKKVKDKFTFPAGIKDIHDVRQVLVDAGISYASRQEVVSQSAAPEDGGTTREQVDSVRFEYEMKMNPVEMEVPEDMYSVEEMKKFKENGKRPDRKFHVRRLEGFEGFAFPETRKILRTLHNNINSICVSSGVLSDGMRDYLQFTMEDYCPLSRDMRADDYIEDYLLDFAGHGIGMANVSVPLNAIKESGSDEPVINPIETILKNLSVAVSRSMRNRVALHAVAQMEFLQKTILDNAKKQVEEEAAKEGTKLTPQTILKRAKTIAKKSEADILPIKKVENGGHASKNQLIFTVMKDGKKLSYKTSRNFYDAIVGTDPLELNAFFSALAFPTTALRLGSTLSPSFVIRNGCRDAAFAYMFSNYGQKPWGMPHGLWKYHTDKRFRSFCNVVGLNMTTYFADLREQNKKMNDLEPFNYNHIHKTAMIFQKALDQFVAGEIAKGSKSILASAGEASLAFLTGPDAWKKARQDTKILWNNDKKVKAISTAFKGTGEGIGDSLGHIVGFFREVSDQVELGTRAEAAWKVYEAWQKGKYGFTGNEEIWQVIPRMAKEAATITLDFGRMGKQTEYANKYIAFFNANVQALDKFFGDLIFRDTGRKGHALFALSHMMAFSTLCWALQVNRDPMERLRINPSLKYGFWIIGSPFDKESSMLRIPKSQEISILLAAWESLLDAYLYGNTDGAKAWARETIKVMLPNFMPNFLLPVAEWSSNYNFFSGRDIEPRRMQSIPTKQRARNTTTLLSKEVANYMYKGFLDSLIGVSPLKIDNLVRSSAGTMGYLAWDFLGRGMEVLMKVFSGDTEYERYSEEFAKSSLIKDFFIHKDNENQMLSSYYEFRKELENTIQDINSTDDERRKARGVLKAINNYYAPAINQNIEESMWARSDEKFVISHDAKIKNPYIGMPMKDRREAAFKKDREANRLAEEVLLRFDEKFKTDGKQKYYDALIERLGKLKMVPI